MEKKKTKAAGRKRSLNAEHAAILNWLKTVRFRRRLFGGLDEDDVWVKLQELDELYTRALLAERMRYDLLLQQRQQEEADEP